VSVLFRQLTVAGVGLIGGSLAAAARQAGVVGTVVGYGRGEENLRLAESRGLIDRWTRDPADAVGAADAVLLAVPVGVSAPVAERLRPYARPGTILTDAGSVKAPVVAALEACWAAVGPVVGAHPIAGSEASGAGAARADLFRGHRCVLTPTPTTDPAALMRVRALWESVGARVEEMAAERHDQILGRISHLPHLVAFALVAAMGQAEEGGLGVLEYAGNGFRDTTRIAGSPADIWRDIILANAGALRPALDEFRQALDRLTRLVADGDAAGLERALAAARALRQRLGAKD
jgi:prephenate dehydrogenase